MIKKSGVPIQCCGKDMQEIVPGTMDASHEKHIPVYKKDGNMITVTVGSELHPMVPEHYIEWVCIETEDGFQYKKLLPNAPPKATFLLSGDENIKAVYAFCNQHSLWKS